jgi:hypothetical protein
MDLVVQEVILEKEEACGLCPSDGRDLSVELEEAHVHEVGINDLSMELEEAHVHEVGINDDCATERWQLS